MSTWVFPSKICCHRYAVTSLCRGGLAHTAGCNILDQFTDKLFDQFVGEKYKKERKVLKENREEVGDYGTSISCCRALPPPGTGGR